jgi:hypothetical protein
MAPAYSTGRHPRKLKHDLQKLSNDNPRRVNYESLINMLGEQAEGALRVIY